MGAKRRANSLGRYRRDFTKTRANRTILTAIRSALEITYRVGNDPGNRRPRQQRSGGGLVAPAVSTSDVEGVGEKRCASDPNRS